jgi:hypothetical protein
VCCIGPARDFGRFCKCYLLLREYAVALARGQHEGTGLPRVVEIDDSDAQ